MHDTALQDTVMVTFCIALSVWLLLRASRHNRTWDWLLAGAAFASIALVRASAAPIIGVALLWTVVWGPPGTIWTRVRASSILVLTIIAILLPWLIHTYRISGTILSTDTGYALWASNNPETFSRYPAKSIDQSTAQALSKLTPDDLAQLRKLSDDPAAKSNWYSHRAMKFVLANPAQALQGVVRKLDAAFSWRLNPFREPLAQAAYAIGYVPVAILGTVGMFLARRRPETALIAMLFLAFMIVTAVFIAHTSHRSHLDVYWAIFAAAVSLSVGKHAVRATRPPLKQAFPNDKAPPL
jgi:4-amino-4-deoxy-L-arabinose transferase-like glycosyltransferase